MKQHISTDELTVKPAWNAVFALALAVSGLIVSEFLPVSLLTPVAKDLRITEGVAGQAISVTAIVAMVSSLLIAVITQRMNRRLVLLAFCVLQIISNLLVANAPNFALLLTGRVLLGIGLGGFWSMAAATALRLVPASQVSRALSIIFSAVSVATVVAAPLGSYLGTHLGWRNVFLIAAAIGGVAFIWQLVTLPSMPTNKAGKISDLFRVLKRPNIKAGMLATMFAFIAYATFFTYLRPFLETVTRVNENTLSTILLGFGIANLLGSTFSRYLLEWNLHRSLALMPFIMAVMVTSLVSFGNIMAVAAVLVSLWGMALGVIQVGWTAWLTRTIPDEAESGGGIQIAVIQLAITAGAAFGGVLYDHTGAKGVFTSSGIFALIATLVALFAFRRSSKRLNNAGKPHQETCATKLVA